MLVDLARPCFASTCQKFHFYKRRCSRTHCAFSQFTYGLGLYSRCCAVSLFVTVVQMTLQFGWNMGINRPIFVISISGIYDVKKHYEHEVDRGVEELSPLARMMSKVGFDSASPQVLLERFLQTDGHDSSHARTSSLDGLKQQVRRMNLRALRSWLPSKWILIHGLQVTFVPFEVS